MKDRQGKEIRKWMIDEELIVEEIARTVGVDKALVSRTIDGKRNNRKVLRFLVARKCPPQVMDLPADIDVDGILKEAA